MENSKETTYRFKKMLPLLVLYLFMSGTGTVWSAEENSATSAGIPGESVASAGDPAVKSAHQESSSVEPKAEPDEIETLPSTSYNPFTYIAYKPLWAITGIIGDFNPIGKYVSTPLEEAISGFRFKGFINSITQLNTTGNDYNAGGARYKDWLIQKQEFRTQFEFKYQYDENLEFVNIYNYSYDGAYDFQNVKGLYRDGSPNQVYYSQGKRIIKEAYARGNYTNVNFTIGKQIVNWGKMDGKVIDIVNAADGRGVVDSHIGDYEWMAIGQWMANIAVRPVEHVTVNLLWNPDFQPNVGPAFGSPYWYPWIPSPRGNTPHLPNITHSGFNDIGESEIGVRVDSTLGALSLSGIYYNGYDRDPVVYSGANHYERLNRYGYALDYGTSIFGQRLIIRSEGLYTIGRSFNTADPLAPKGIVKSDQFKGALAFETSFFSDENKVDFLYQPIWLHTFDYNNQFLTVTARNDFLHVINIGHSIRATNDKLSLGATFYISGGSNNTGWAAVYSAGWKFNDYLKATLAYNDYEGHNDQIPWGVYNKWKNVTIDVKYEW